MRYLPFLICLSALAAPAARAQNITLELDRPDWLYHVGDSAQWRIRSDRAARVVVLFTHEQQRLKPLSVDTLDLAAHQVLTLRRTMHEPGFLRAIVRPLASTDTVARVATAAFDPDRITPSVELPADFVEFWRAGIADARKVPLEPVMTRVPERSTDAVDVYHISFQNQRAGSRLYGILSMPKGAGPFPAMLVVPGAGVRPYFPSHEWARRGVIHLAIGIHGIPVDRDSLLYNELRATALQNYNTAQVEDRERYYYRRVFIGVVRAGDFIFSLPQFDRKTYVVRGGSQGGGLAIVAGALDPRVTAIASAYPALSDHLAYLSGRVGGWPHIFADTAAVKAKAEKIETLRYYDVVNFARLLRVPAYFLWGYNDPVVPPRSMYAAYNVITSRKSADVYPPAVHGASRPQREREEAWLARQLAK